MIFLAEVFLLWGRRTFAPLRTVRKTAMTLQGEKQPEATVAGRIILCKVRIVGAWSPYCRQHAAFGEDCKGKERVMEREEGHACDYYQL